MIKGLVKFMRYGIAALVLFPLAVIICSTLAGLVICGGLCVVSVIIVGPAWLAAHYNNPWLSLAYVPWAGFWSMVAFGICEKLGGTKV